MSNKRTREKRRRWCKSATMKGIFSTVARVCGKDYFNRPPIFPLFTDEVDDARLYGKGFVIPCRGLTANVKPPEDVVTITRRTIATKLPWDAGDFVETQRCLGKIQDEVQARLNALMMRQYEGVFEVEHSQRPFFIDVNTGECLTDHEDE